MDYPFPKIQMVLNKTQKKIIPKYPKNGEDYSFEENLADWNCLYYDVLRSLQRRVQPESEILNNSSKHISHIDDNITTNKG